MSITRGAFAAGAAIVLAGCGVRSQLRSAIYNCRLPEALPLVTGGTILRGTFQSRVLGKPVGYAITRSPGNGPVRGVAYAMPERGGTAEELFATLGHDRYLATLANELDFPALAVAAVDAGDTYWHKRAGGEDRMAMFNLEFIPRARHDLALADDIPESLLGYSMGGYGALLAASQQPHRYRAVAVAGPTIWQSYGQQQAADPGAFDNKSDFERHSILGRVNDLRLQELLIDCGRADPFADTIELLRTSLPHAVVRFREGCHDDAFYSSTVPDQLRFVGHRLSLR